MPPQWLIPDPERGDCVKLASAAMQNDEMSVGLGDALSDEGRTPESMLEGPQFDGFGLVALPAGTAREFKQIVCRDPVDDEPVHGLVVGNKKKRKRDLARASKWVVAPDGACEPPAV